MLRAHWAVIAFVGILLIPVATSSLRGLHHVITCQEEVATPFTIHVPKDGPPLLLSAAETAFDPQGREGEVCGGLLLDLVAVRRLGDEATMRLELHNNSTFAWSGSVHLDFDGTTLPIHIGRVDGGEAASHTIEIQLDDEQTYDLEGSLLIGP